MLFQVTEGIVLTFKTYRFVIGIEVETPVFHIYFVVLQVVGRSGTPCPFVVEMNLMRGTHHCIVEAAFLVGSIVDGVDVLDVQFHIPRLVDKA